MSDTGEKQNLKKKFQKGGVRNILRQGPGWSRKLKNSEEPQPNEAHIGLTNATRRLQRARFPCKVSE